MKKLAKKSKALLGVVVKTKVKAGGRVNSL